MELNKENIKTTDQLVVKKTQLELLTLHNKQLMHETNNYKEHIKKLKARIELIETQDHLDLKDLAVDLRELLIAFSSDAILMNLKKSLENTMRDRRYLRKTNRELMEKLTRYENNS